MESKDEKLLVLGLVGNAASGKDYIASIFERNGFIHYSTSELLREHIYKRGLQPTRKLQTEIANELRITNGNNYFVKESLRRINSVSSEKKKILLSGLYAVSEGEYIINELNGKLISVIASDNDSLDSQIRFKRLTSRSDGSRDNLNHAEFLEAYQRENSGEKPFETNVGKLIKMAIFSILNNSQTSREDLEKQVNRIIQAL